MLTARRNWTNFLETTFLGPIRELRLQNKHLCWYLEKHTYAENHRPVLIIVTEVPGTTDWYEYLNANLTNCWRLSSD